MSKNSLLFLSGGAGNTSPALSLGGVRSQVMPRNPPTIRVLGDLQLPGVSVIGATKNILTQGSDSDTIVLDWDRSLSYPRVKAYKPSTPGTYDMTNLPTTLEDGIYFVKYQYTYIHIQIVAAQVSAVSLTSQPINITTDFTGHLTYPTGGIVTAQEPWYGSSGGYSMNLPSGVYLASAWGLRDSFANSFVGSFNWEVSPLLTSIGVSSAVDYLGNSKSYTTKTVSGSGFYHFVWDTCGVVFYVDVGVKEKNNVWRSGEMHLRDTARFLPALSTADHTAGRRRSVVWYMKNCEASELSIQVTSAATGSPSSAAFVQFGAPGDGISSGVVASVAGNLDTTVTTAVVPVNQFAGLSIQMQPTGVAPFPAENVSYLSLETR